jgi:hypothetical protein
MNKRELQAQEQKYTELITQLQAKWRQQLEQASAELHQRDTQYILDLEQLQQQNRASIE